MKLIPSRLPGGQRRLQVAAALAAVIALVACRDWRPRASSPAAEVPETVAQAERPMPVDAGAVGETICGTPGRPLCPLEAWMEAELSVPMQSRDWAQLTRSLTKLAASAPAAFPRWAPWAKAAVSAVRTNDVERVRAACRDCHDDYRDEYRRRMPNRPAPATNVAAGPDRGEGVWGRIPLAPPKMK